MTRNELADKYGITVERVREESLAFLQSEGYLGDGHECQTFCEWLDCRMKGKHEDRPSWEPWQKGDEYPE